MCKLIGWRPLFKDEFRGGAKPPDFGFLIRPTLAQFNEFAHLLDKMLSENLSKDFFRGEIALESEHPRKDGKIEVWPKGTIQLLDEWLVKKFKTLDRTPIQETIQTFKRVRQARQKPAHAVDDDVFDQKYYHEQREIMKKAYVAVQTLRLALANDPKASSFHVPDSLVEGKIWTQ
jgi:hypothetical protein